MSVRFIYLILIGSFLALTSAAAYTADEQARPLPPELSPYPLPTTQTKPSAQETLTSQCVFYTAGSRFYIAPNGMQYLDARKTGPIYPNLFDVVRTGANGLYISEEDQDKGCNLLEKFRVTVFKVHGFDARLYLDALASSSEGCDRLPSLAQRDLCTSYHTDPSCADAKPLALLVLPLPPGVGYKDFSKTSNFNCSAAIEKLLSYNYVPQECREWSKIASDLLEKRRAEYSKSISQNPPRDQIRQQLLAINPGASPRDIDFAVKDWVYTQSRAFNVDIPHEEIQTIAQKRYSPAGAIDNILQFKANTSKTCKGGDLAYKNKMYAESFNIPVHETLLFNDLVSPANLCICPR